MNSDADAPKKYIRTLAGDMEILESGGKPDLAPFMGSKPTPDERLVASSPVAPLPAPVQPPPTPIEPSPVPQPKEPTPIETYANDFSDRMKEEHAAPITILAAEQDALSEKTPTEPAPRSRSSVVYTIIGIFLLVDPGKIDIGQGVNHIGVSK